MATNQKYFEDALKKGELGEGIIRKYLEEKGWIVYFPFTKDKPHYFDMLATKDKEKVIACDVKTKARLNKYNAQGINTSHYKQYMDFVNKTMVPFFLFFVDDKTGDVHCAELVKLKDPKFIGLWNHIIIWDLNQMTHLFKIDEEMIRLLSEYDHRNYDFNPTT